MTMNQQQNPHNSIGKTANGAPAGGPGYKSNGSKQMRLVQDDQLSLTNPQGQIARSNHREGYNQMQSLGDALSKKGDDFDDPDFEQYSPVTPTNKSH